MYELKILDYYMWRHFLYSLSMYCKLVKVRTLCILCNNWCLFVPRDLTPELAWHLFNTAWVKFPCPNKIDRFVHNDGDIKSKLLSLSLRYMYFAAIIIACHYLLWNRLLTRQLLYLIKPRECICYFKSGTNPIKES